MNSTPTVTAVERGLRLLSCALIVGLVSCSQGSSTHSTNRTTPTPGERNCDQPPEYRPCASWGSDKVFAAPIHSAPVGLVPAGALLVDGWQRDDVGEVWFTLREPLTKTEGLLRSHLQKIGWQMCGPQNNRVVAIGPFDPHHPRISDRFFDASNGQKWDLSVTLYREGAARTYGDIRLIRARHGSECGSPHGAKTREFSPSLRAFKMPEPQRSRKAVPVH